MASMHTFAYGLAGAVIVVAIIAADRLLRRVDDQLGQFINGLGVS